MTAPTITGQESTMNRAKLKISFGLALAVLVSALVLAPGASARVPIEPGPGSPVTHQHVRQPSVNKALYRLLGGFPVASGVHVRVPVELRTE
jgi:hypothetical protein